MSTAPLARRQRGISLIGLMIVGAMLAFVLLLGFRTVPALNEYLALQRIVKVVATEGQQSASNADMRTSFDRRAQIDSVTSVTGRDLMITREAGVVVVAVAWERRVPVAGNVSLLFEFNARGFGR